MKDTRAAAWLGFILMMGTVGLTACNVGEWKDDGPFSWNDSTTLTRLARVDIRFYLGGGPIVCDTICGGVAEVYYPNTYAVKGYYKPINWPEILANDSNISRRRYAAWVKYLDEECVCKQPMGADSGHTWVFPTLEIVQIRPK